MRNATLAPLFFSITAALLLTACAPTTSGSQAGAPISVGGAPVPVQQGATVYLRVDYSLAAFGLKFGDLSPTLWIPSGYSSEVGNVEGSFALTDLNAAPGWEVELAQMKLEHSTSVSTSSDRTSTATALWAVVKVTVPTDIVPGVYRVRGTIQARNGGSQPLALQLEVAP